MVMSPWLGRDFRRLWKLDSPGIELQLNSEPVGVSVRVRGFVVRGSGLGLWLVVSD
jgi:hypothetical protein